MKTIIAPTDFSTVSDNACLYAAKMAEDIKANLLLLHVMETPLLVSEFPGMADAFDKPEADEQLMNLKDKLFEQTAGKVNIQTKNAVGSTEYELTRLSEVSKPFAIIMGTHTPGVLSRFFTGSTTIYSARHLHCPVLVIPVGVEYTPIKKIALATDLKDVYTVPVFEIEAIAQTLNASLEIFYTGKNETIIDRASIANLLLNHRLENLRPETFFVEDVEVERSIVALATNHQVDMIMIIPKKHLPLHKSASKDFILYSPIPVMAIHENDSVAAS